MNGEVDWIVLTFNFLLPNDQWELRSVWLPAALIRHNTATNTYPCIQGVHGGSDPYMEIEVDPTLLAIDHTRRVGGQVWSDPVGPPMGHPGSMWPPNGGGYVPYYSTPADRDAMMWQFISNQAHLGAIWQAPNEPPLALYYIIIT